MRPGTIDRRPEPVASNGSCKISYRTAALFRQLVNRSGIRLPKVGPSRLDIWYSHLILTTVLLKIVLPRLALAGSRTGH